MSVSTQVAGYSLQVRIELHLAGQRFPLAQIGRDCIVFDEPRELPATEGRVVLWIDGQPRHWAVTLRPNHPPGRVIAAEFSEIT